MPKKLTLSIDEELIKFAHSYSKKVNSSLSSIVGNFLQSLRVANNKKSAQYSQKTASILGAFSENKLPSKKQMRKEFHEDHIS